MVDLKKNVDELCGIAKQLDNQELYQVSLFLRQRINQPDSYVVFVGESCSGKSTIINSLIRKISFLSAVFPLRDDYRSFC